MVALFTLLPLFTLVTLLTLIACSFVKDIPSFATVVRNVPEVFFDLQHRRNTVLAVLTVSTIFAVLAIFAVSSRFTVLTVFGICFHLVSAGIGEPFAIDCPVIFTVHILLHTNLRCIAIDTIFAVLTRFAILARFAILTIITVVNSDRVRLHECDGIAYLLAIFHQRIYTGNDIMYHQ